MMCVCAHPVQPLETPETVACQAPLSLEFFRQEWSGLPLPTPEKRDDRIYQIVMYVVSIGYVESNEIFVLKYQYL